MATSIYLGMPPENIKRFIIENYSKPVDMTKVPLHFTANEDGSSVSLVCYDDMEGDFIDSWCELQYSTDEMKSWKDYPKEANSEEAEIKLDSCENKTVYFKAKQGNIEGNPNLNGFGYYDRDDEAVTQWHRFAIKGSIKAGGNIQFLLENTGTKMDVPKYCYQYMFENCKSLTQAPLLPAMTLANDCYYGMFYHCTSLTNAPTLPAMTLAEGCYQYMFESCTNLIQAPELPATKLAAYCYYKMFEGCIALTQAPALPATKVTYHCYQSMFEGCTSLTQAPELPATELADNCYYNMFRGCTNINSINVNFSEWDTAESATVNWVYGVSSSGIFTCPEDLPIEFNSNRIPNGWDVNP